MAINSDISVKTEKSQINDLRFHYKNLGEKKQI
jgi:hypothetical protein